MQKTWLNEENNVGVSCSYAVDYGDIFGLTKRSTILYISKWSPKTPLIANG